MDIKNWKEQFIEKCKYREFYPHYRTPRFVVIMEEIQELEKIVSQLLQEKEEEFLDCYFSLEDLLSEEYKRNLDNDESNAYAHAIALAKQEIYRKYSPQEDKQ